MVRAQRLVAAVALAVALLSGAPAPALARVAQPYIEARAAILVTSEGAVLWSKNADQPRRVASTTKMLTALTVRDHAQLDDLITITPKAVRVDDGVVGLKTGQRYTVRQLLDVMLVHSANGAAEALAIGVGGDEVRFVRMMEAKALSLGLTHTHPADAHGLSPKGVSTAADLSVIARHFMADPVLRGIVAERSSVSFNGGSFSTTDHLLSTFRGIEGIKTGYTDPAGYCFAGAARRGNVELFSIVLGTDAPEDRFTQTATLLDWGFAHAIDQTVVSREQTMGAVQVEDGAGEAVTVHPARGLTLPLLAGGGCGVTTQVSLPSTIAAPVSAGERLGHVFVSCAGSVIATIPLVADMAVDRAAEQPAAAVASPVNGPQRADGLWLDVTRVWANLGRALGI